MTQQGSAYKAGIKVQTRTEMTIRPTSIDLEASIVAPNLSYEHRKRPSAKVHMAHAVSGEHLRWHH